MSSRRSLRLAAPLALAALAAGSCGSSSSSSLPPPASPDAAVAGPDAAPPPPPPADEASRFSLVVIPDTQYLFDQDRGDPDVLAASLDWIVAHAASEKIVFTAALGDIVENHGADELAAASDTYATLDAHGIPYSTPAGNHDLESSSRYDDQRAADEPYLTHFSPARHAGTPGYGGASDGGYNTYFTFEGGGQTWLLLALDWRASMASLAWAQGVIDAHPTLPVILTTHELVHGDEADASGGAALSDYGQYLWDHLIAQNDQIVLTLNGHFWPPARTVLQNAAGHDVHLHIVNYQDRYFGGSGMIRLYRFDLARGTIDVSTFSPYWQAQPAGQLGPLARAEAERNDDRSRFVDHLDFAARFRGFQGGAPPEPPARPARQVLVPGTLAYWRFDEGTPGAAVTSVRDLSGHGNDLERVTLPNGVPGDMVYSADHDPDQPGHASLQLHGSRANPALAGAYLRTVAGAPLDTMTLTGGYTVEAFVRLPADCCGDDHAWMGLLSRMGTGGDAGKTGGDPDEPVGTLTVPPGGGLQWAIFPVNREDIVTSWSHPIRGGGAWFHVAVVNDGHHSTMYVDGEPVLRNPRAESVGVATHAESWLLGATHYGRVVEQSFYGWIGDVRIVDHALTPAELMRNRQ